MPKRKTICTAFLLPLTLTGWSLHCTAQKELSWVGGTVFVFGDVFEAGGIVRHRFLLRNAGEATFHILSARPGCDCTSAVYDTRSVQPGDTAWVEVSYDPHGQEGPFRERVRVETDSPAGCNTLFIKGTVVPSGDGGDRPSVARQEVGTAEERD